MTKIIFFISALFLLSPSVSAQPIAIDKYVPAFESEEARKWANIISWSTLTTSMAFGVKDSCFEKVNRKHDCIMFGVKTGVTYAAGLTVKSLFDRDRPCGKYPEGCGAENPKKSLYSLHTAATCQNIKGHGKMLAFNISLGIGTAAGRDFAGKHWLTDTLVGCGAGLLAAQIQ